MFLICMFFFVEKEELQKDNEKLREDNNNLKQELEAAKGQLLELMIRKVVMQSSTLFNT